MPIPLRMQWEEFTVRLRKLDEQISDIAENVTNVSETISQSAQGVSQIAEKSLRCCCKDHRGRMSCFVKAVTAL